MSRKVLRASAFPPLEAPVVSYTLVCTAASRLRDGDVGRSGFARAAAAIPPRRRIRRPARRRGRSRASASAIDRLARERSRRTAARARRGRLHDRSGGRHGCQRRHRSGAWGFHPSRLAQHPTTRVPRGVSRRLCRVRHEPRWLFNGPITYLSADDDLAAMKRRGVAQLVDRTRAARSRLLVTCARTRTIGCSWRTASPSTCASGGCSVVSAPDYRDSAIGDLDLAMRAEQAGLSMA